MYSACYNGCASKVGPSSIHRPSKSVHYSSPHIRRRFSSTSTENSTEVGEPGVVQFSRSHCRRRFNQHASAQNSAEMLAQGCRHQRGGMENAQSMNCTRHPIVLCCRRARIRLYVAPYCHLLQLSNAYCLTMCRPKVPIALVLPSPRFNVTPLASRYSHSINSVIQSKFRNSMQRGGACTV